MDDEQQGNNSHSNTSSSDQSDDSQEITDESNDDSDANNENDITTVSPVNSSVELEDQGSHNDDQGEADLPDGAQGGGGVIDQGDDENLMRPEYLCQHGIPQKHCVAFFDEDYGWTNVILTSPCIRRYGSNYNYLGDDGFEGGVYLDPYKRWTFIEDSCCAECTGEEAQADIGQVDGVHISNSLTPTPKTTP